MLTVVSLEGRPLASPIVAEFASAGGTVGRADHSTLVLPDPEKNVSRKQAEIFPTRDGFVIRNVSAVIPIHVGSRTLAAGESTVLANAEEIRIAAYVLRSSMRGGAEGDVVAAGPPLGGASPGAARSRAFAEHAAWPSDAVRRSSEPDGPSEGREFRDLIDGSVPAQPTALSPTDDRSLWELVGVPEDEPPPPDRSSRQERDPLPDQPPRQEAGDPGVEGVPLEDEAAFATDALLEAFCRGAGIAPETIESLTAERMHLIGRLLHASIDGIIQLNKNRAETKYHLRAQVTEIQRNPLKIYPKAGMVLDQLLGQGVPGQLRADEAMGDAVRDLIGHAVGTLAGIRAAFEGVLSRFDPEVLESKIAERSGLAKLFPVGQKSKLWELYLEHYAGIRDEANEDFNKLFGRAFLAAYEQQVARFRKKSQ